jgi:hypothetical protein
VSLDQRLSRLAPALTAQERAILILEAWKEDKLEDPLWRQAMPQEQSRAFNHYIELMNEANRVLGVLINILFQQAEKVEMWQGWLTSLVCWQDHIDEIREAVRIEVKSPAARKRLDAVLDWTPEVDGRALPVMPGSLIEAMRETTAYKLISAWIQVECIRAAVDDVAAEFNGIDPLRPALRQKITSTREKLQATKEHLQVLGMDVVLRDPLDEELEEIRSWLAERLAAS